MPINGKTIKAIIPARMTSSRLPGKVLLDVAGKPVLQRMIERVKASEGLDGIVIAFTKKRKDDCLVDFCEKNAVEYFRGSEDNVLERIIGAAKATGTDVVAELTSDCPLIDWRHIGHLINVHMCEYPEIDMTTNIKKRTWPRGYDIRIVNFEALERSFGEIDNHVDYEHVLTWMYLNPKGKKNYRVNNWYAPAELNRPDLQITLDSPEDLELIRWIYGFGSQGYNMELNCQQVVNLLDTYGHLQVCQAANAVPRKSYLEELKEAYKSQDKKQEGEDEEVSGSDNWSGETSSIMRRTRK